MRTHTVKYYSNGVGHIERRGSEYLVSFYGRRVSQAVVSTRSEAVKALSELAKAAR